MEEEDLVLALEVLKPDFGGHGFWGSVAMGIDGLWLGSGFDGCRGCWWVVVGFGFCWLPWVLMGCGWVRVVVVVVVAGVRCG
jgi:hypothetical protein